MVQYRLKDLSKVNPLLVSKLKQWCYDLNGCCQIVHKDMGPFLNEYMYQDALEIALKEQGINHLREYYFSVEFHGKRINHKHFVDFLCKDNVLLECKAIAKISNEQRQQLWNYMRLSKINIGILWNFAPIKDQSEHYYLDIETGDMYIF